MKNANWDSPGNKATGQTHIYITYSCWDFVPRKDHVFLDESASHPSQRIKPACWRDRRRIRVPEDAAII